MLLYRVSKPTYQPVLTRHKMSWLLLCLLCFTFVATSKEAALPELVPRQTVPKETVPRETVPKESIPKKAVALAALPSEALLSEKVDCIQVTRSHDQINHLIASGKYRDIKPSDNKNTPAFSYSTTLSYQQYLRYARQQIQSKNPRAAMPCPVHSPTYKMLAKQHNWSATPSVSQLISPFELTNTQSNKAILLIHGLTDSPYFYHDLAQFFYQQGFTVRTVLLPGHATAPSELLKTSYQEWQQAAQYAIKRTLLDFDEVFLGGFSTGGALIFDYLMQQERADSKIKGLFMWSLASKAKSDFAWLAEYVNYIPFVNWLVLDADMDFAKYESFPYNAAAQAHHLMSRIVGDNALKNRKIHDIPIFAVASEHDQTIETTQTLALLEEWQQPLSFIHNKHSALVYYGEQQTLSKRLLDHIRVIIPECAIGGVCAEISDIAHVSLTNAPQNQHYGELGYYRSCGHYISKATKYLACKTNQQIIKGEITEQNLARYPLMQRLTFNPYYQQMLNSMQGFLTSVH